MNDIETIIQDKNIIRFAKDLFKCEFNSHKEYIKNYDIQKKKYKMCPNKPTLNKLYFKLLKDGEIKENKNFLNFSLKKKVRSSSGVSVQVILMKTVKQLFKNLVVVMIVRIVQRNQL